MGFILMNTDLEQEKKLEFLKIHFKERTKTKVIAKCLEIAYNTVSQFEETAQK
jgi:hypothetical protein